MPAHHIETAERTGVDKANIWLKMSENLNLFIVLKSFNYKINMVHWSSWKHA